MKKPHGGQRRTYEIRVEGGVAFIPLSRGLEAMIDASDVDLVAGVSWHASTKPPFYATRLDRIDKTDKRKVTFMHRVIIGAPPGVMVDHANGNGLDNRRSNLRLCSHAQNQRNRRAANALGIKGVYPNRSKYAARISVNGKAINLGTFSTPGEAAAAYAAAAILHFGEFARHDQPTPTPCPELPAASLAIRGRTR